MLSKLDWSWLLESGNTLNKVNLGYQSVNGWGKESRRQFGRSQYTSSLNDYCCETVQNKSKQGTQKAGQGQEDTEEKVPSFSWVSGNPSWGCILMSAHLDGLLHT